MTDRKKTFDLMDRYILTDRNLDRIADVKRLISEIEMCTKDQRILKAAKDTDDSAERLWQSINDAYWELRRNLWDTVPDSSPDEKTSRQPSKEADDGRR